MINATNFGKEVAIYGKKINRKFFTKPMASSQLNIFAAKVTRRKTNENKVTLLLDTDSPKLYSLHDMKCKLFCIHYHDECMSLQTVAVATYLILKSRKQKRRKRTIWCRQLFVNSDDKQNDLFNNLMADDGALFRNFTRMDKHDFDYLLNKVAPLISKADTNFRCSIPAKVKLYCTLRFLATGDSYRSLMYLFRISDSTISLFIPEVCRAIILVLKEYIKMPSTNDGWRDVSREFDVAWNFPHCIGCVDGKQVVMQNPNNAGSMYLNYKGTFSIVLMAVCDANYCFTFADAGIQGRISDGGAFRETTFFKKLEKNKLNVPIPEPLPLQRLPRRSAEGPKSIRDEFKAYFNTPEGKVPWQDHFI
nr:unnamed protein product [Callosobruchus analis]